MNDAALARAEAASETVERRETLAAMKDEIAARLSAEDKELLLAISADYEELAWTLAAPKSDPA